MSDLDINLLTEAYYSKLQQTNCEFVRYLYNKINWDARLIGIKGARGVGKTTLLIQRIKLAFNGDVGKCFYTSLDNLWFNDNSLLDLVRHLYNQGIKYLFLDEVHKYPNWSQNLKNIYDMYPTLNVVYTGSSLLEIDHSIADLSRRQTMYVLRSMSFREYLEYENIANIKPIPFADILNSHIQAAFDITSQINVLQYFPDYLRHGCYPYYKASGNDYFIHLSETIRQTIENDVPAIEPFEYQTLEKIKKLLMIMASHIPFVPNMKDLSQQISATRNLGIKLLYLLDKANILRLVTEKMKSYKNLLKPEKVLFDNSNIMYAFCSNPEIGTVRETFFANQIEYAGYLTSPKQGDFLLNEKFLFEVGGRTKTFNQIKDIPESYLAVDDTAIGNGNRIPLWIFGMMY